MFGSLRPIANQTLADNCYGSIKAAILELSLAPRSPLDEAQIALQLGVSKTPVREALARLTGEGFITSVGRKSFVAELSIELIHEIYQVRIMLETSSIREVSPHISAQSLAALNSLVAGTRRALIEDDLVGFLKTSARFHQALLEESHNRFLVDYTSILFDHAERVTSAIFQIERQSPQHPVSTHGVSTHQQILDALGEHDGEQAAELIRRDIRATLDALDTAEMQRAFASLAYH